MRYQVGEYVCMLCLSKNVIEVQGKYGITALGQNCTRVKERSVLGAFTVFFPSQDRKLMYKTNYYKQISKKKSEALIRVLSS